MIEAVVAVYANWGIGCDGTQPVVLPEDRAHFRALTQNATILVGRRTLADFPDGKPLKGRVNLVLSRSLATVDGAILLHSAQEALAAAKDHARVLVVGGAQVYKAMFPHIYRVYVTKIDSDPHSDAFFPDLDTDPAWYVTQEEPEQISQNGLHYRFLTYERRGVATR